MKHIQITIPKQEKKKYDTFDETIKHFQYEKWKKFISEVKLIQDRNRRRNILIFELLISTGMRVFEFSQIRVADIDFEKGLIHIKSENTKTKQSRVVRVNKRIIVDLIDYLNSNRINSGFIFRNKKRQPLNVRTYQKIFEKYFIKYGLQKKLDIEFKVTPHKFRHNMVIYSLENGIPINAVMSQAGHKNMKTTETYAKISGVGLIKAYGDIDF